MAGKASIAGKALMVGISLKYCKAFMTCEACEACEACKACKACKDYSYKQYLQSIPYDKASKASPHRKS
jgi:hypothetical protein